MDVSGEVMLRTSRLVTLFVFAVFFTAPFVLTADDNIKEAGDLRANHSEFDPGARDREVDPPEVEVDINAIEDELNIGGSCEYLLTFSNLGENAIEFSIEHEIIDEPDRDMNNTRRIRSSIGNTPYRDDPGDILFQFEINHVRNEGFDWDPDANVMWVAAERPNFIHAYAYDGEGGVEVMLLPFQNEREILVLSSCFLDVKFLADKV